MHVNYYDYMSESSTFFLRTVFFLKLRPTIKETKDRIYVALPSPWLMSTKLRVKFRTKLI